MNEIIGVNASKTQILITLLDGRCALLDRENKVFTVEVLLDSFYKWMDFFKVDKNEYIDEVNNILENPTGYGFGPLAKEYLTDEKTRKFFDKIKKEANYNY